MGIENLFQQTKNIRGSLGTILYGPPEILIGAETWIDKGSLVSRNQIKKVLEYVPSTFPESWKIPKSYRDLNKKQKEAYRDISKRGDFSLPLQLIQEIIKFGVWYRNWHSNLNKN